MQGNLDFAAPFIDNPRRKLGMRTCQSEGPIMKNTLFGFGVVYLIGAVVFTLGVAPVQPMKNLAVLEFLLPGVVALVAGLEIARLRTELRELRSRDKAPSAP